MTVTSRGNQDSLLFLFCGSLTWIVRELNRNYGLEDFIYVVQHMDSRQARMNTVMKTQIQ